MQSNEVTVELMEVDYQIEALEERLEMAAVNGNGSGNGNNVCVTVCCASCHG